MRHSRTSLVVRALWIAAALLVAPTEAVAGRAAGTEHPRVSREAFHAEALRATRHYTVYRPPGYDEDDGRRYPVLYLLHGLGGDDGDWFEHGRLARHLDRAIAEERLPPILAVAPDGDDGYWTNHAPRDGRPGPRFGDLVAEDLVRAVDARHRTIPDAEHRVLAGVSMGGFGALSLALVHPRRFGAAVSLSGALFPEVPDHREVYRRAWGHPPEPERFRRVSPQHLLAKVPEGRVPAIYLHCGDDDPLGFLPYTLKAHRTLARRGVEHELRISDGRHSWAVWERQADDWLAFVREVLEGS
ncbi:MAG: alpha/beta hydrolase [Myxococcota bacterium]